MIRVRVAGEPATLDAAGKWTTADPLLERLLNAMTATLEPEVYDPFPAWTTAAVMVERLGGRIITKPIPDDGADDGRDY